MEEKFPKFLTLNLLVHNESPGRDIYDLSQYRIDENKQIPRLVVARQTYRMKYRALSPHTADKNTVSSGCLSWET